MTKIGLIVIAAVILFGCSSSSYGIRLIDGAPREIYLTFSKGTDVKVGEIFTLYRIQQPPSGSGQHAGHGGHGGGGRLNFRQEVGKVQVLSIADETHALVRVLSGYAEDGLAAEKVE